MEEGPLEERPLEEGSLKEGPLEEGPWKRVHIKVPRFNTIIQNVRNFGVSPFFRRQNNTSWLRGVFQQRDDLVFQMGLQQGVLRGDRHLRGESAGYFW